MRPLENETVKRLKTKAKEPEETVKDTPTSPEETSKASEEPPIKDEEERLAKKPKEVCLSLSVRVSRCLCARVGVWV